MNETTFAATPRPAISDAERARRLKAVNFARGSVRYEGGILTEEVEALAARFVAGDISSDEMTAAIVERYATRP